MERLHTLLGGEHEPAAVARELLTAVRALAPATIGAALVTCSDESELEEAEAFQEGFAREALPRLKSGTRSPFRMANPGARYEEGAAAIAEAHFATPESAQGFKVLVGKVNGHVGVIDSEAERPRFGRLLRYGVESTCCGAIDALLQGSDLPFVRDLRDALRSDGRDRVAELHEVEEPLRPLFGAMVSARVQARRLAADVRRHVPETPTLYLLLFGVTLNKAGPDTEIPAGLYVIDRRTDTPEERYRGLGDDPRAYVLATEEGRLCIDDPALAETGPRS